MNFDRDEFEKEIWACVESGGSLVNFHYKNVCLNPRIRRLSKRERNLLCPCTRILARMPQKHGQSSDSAPGWNRKHFISDNFVKSGENNLASSSIRTK